MGCSGMSENENLGSLFPDLPGGPKLFPPSVAHVDWAEYRQWERDRRRHPDHWAQDSIWQGGTCHTCGRFQRDRMALAVYVRDNQQRFICVNPAGCR